eukprot:CAMPEP_0118867650 /NCGR_PEP_ID=MMETSP1163-20130328/11184_1 /TAXON_ID=124430 /ORGANISM="Phaeomonas parva, Strain CCMP2877" /LENGTH=37 /DNA_ID= /DNA_START= /DNA_END= /DNA_ORIENTATION=
MAAYAQHAMMNGADKAIDGVGVEDQPFFGGIESVSAI